MNAANADAASVDLARSARLGLDALVEDVEHVILPAEVAGVAAGDAGAGDVAEVLAAARRTERVVTMLGDVVLGDAVPGDAVPGDVASSVRGALEGYVAARGGTVDEARRVTVMVGMEDIEAQDIDAQDDDGVRRVVVGDLRELAEALNARWDEQWCATRQFCC